MTSAALQRPRAIARYIVAATAVAMQERAQYRVNLWIWSLASILQIVISLAVWRAVARAGDGSVAGYAASEFVGYFLVLLVVREMTYTGVPWRFEDWVRDGTLASRLLRPRHPLLYFFASDIAFRVYSGMVIFPAAIVLGFAFNGRVDATPTSVALTVLLVPVATVTRLMADSIVACSAMWFVRINGIRGMYYLVMLFLGGQFAPLSVLPERFEQVARWLPFYWMLGYPVELAIGRAPIADAWFGLGALLGWLLALWLVLQFVWARGVRAHESVGQ